MKRFWEKVTNYVSQKRIRVIFFILLLYFLLAIGVIVIPGYLYYLFLEISFPYMEEIYLNFYLPYVLIAGFVFRHYHIKYLSQIRYDLLDKYNDLNN